MDSAFWTRMHGGVTHFPIAMMIASMVFDIIGYSIQREPHSRDLHAAAFYSLMLGALGSFGAVLSGLVISGWNPWGSGLLLKHHTFVWPAFGLIVALAVWRLMSGPVPARRAFAMYLVVSVAAAMVMSTAGYWGGELFVGQGG